MDSQAAKGSILESFRVLDLTDEKGFLCGKILGDMGADVLKVERPGGDRARNIGPFYRNTPHPEKSIHWFAYNVNKRGITLNLETRDGRQLFSRLVEKADFVIESFPLGYMDSLGLSYAALSNINPRIIMTSITPFGQTGPYKDYTASDIVGMAMGGLMYITGTQERTPLRISAPQAYLQAAAHATAATMIAHYYRETSGQGQHVDVSMYESIVWGLANAIPLWELNHIILKRVGSYLSGRWTGTKQRLVWECRDGFIIFYVMGGAFGIKSNRGIVQWMEEIGMTNEYLQNMDWSALDMGTQTQEQQDKIEEPLAGFFTTFTKAELVEGAFKRGIMLAPVSSPKDTMGNKQLKARDFWVDVEHPELETKITYPGAFIKASETPFVARHRAPLIGEHNLEIYEGELGLSRHEICILKQVGAI